MPAPADGRQWVTKWVTPRLLGRRPAEERRGLGGEGTVGSALEGQRAVVARRGPVLPGRCGEFKRATERAGRPAGIRFYDLRHGNATPMLVAGVAPKAGVERLGHSSVVLFNDTYAHMLQEIDADAAAKLGAVIKGHTRRALC